MTDTIDVAALVERLRYRVNNPSAWDFYDQGASDLFAELATALQSQADALAEARREMSDWRNGDLAGVKAHLDAAVARATTAEASLATMREALEKALAKVEYQPGDHPVVPIKHAQFVEDIRSLGGSNAE